MRRLRTVLKKLGIGAVALAVLLVLGLVGALVWLNTQAGSERLKTELLTRINPAISGRIAVDHLSVRFNGNLVLDGVALYDPDGGLVARIGHLEASADLDHLLEKKILVRTADVRDAELDLFMGRKGLNLNRAIAARVKKAPQPKKPGAGLDWEIEAGKVTFKNFKFEFKAESRPKPIVALGGVDIRFDGGVGPRGARLDFLAQGAMTEPEQVPFRLKVVGAGGTRADPSTPVKVTTLELDAGDTKLALNEFTRDGDVLAADFRNLHVGAKELKAFFPGAPLLTDGDVKGTVRFDARTLAGKLRVEAAGGSADIDTFWDVATVAAKGEANVKLAGVNLGAVLKDFPQTGLTGDLSARYAFGGNPSPGEGHVDAHLVHSTFRGAKVDALDASLVAQGKAVRINDLRAQIPGAKLQVSGEASADELALHGIADVSNGRAASLTASAMAGVAPPELSGSAHVELDVSGPSKRPRVRAKATVPMLEIQGAKVESANVVADLPDASNPLIMKAKVHAKAFVSGELNLAEVHVDGDANGRTYNVDIGSKGMAGITAHVAGLVDPDRKGTRVDALTLALGDAKWSLEDPAHLSFADGVKVSKAVLSSGPQKLTVEGGLIRKKLDVSAELHAVDLGRLPAPLVPKKLGLAGKVTGHAKLTGDPKRPEGLVDVTGSGLAFQNVKDLELSAQLTSRDGRAEGTANASRHGAVAKARFDLPLKLFGAPAATPLSAKVEASGVKVAEWAAMLGVKDLQGGTAGFEAELSGTSGNPIAKLIASGTRLETSKLPPLELGLVANAGEDASADVTMSSAAGQIVARASLPLSLASLLKSPPTAESLKTVPLTGSVNATRLDLAPLADLLPAGVTGRVSLNGRVNGTLGRPRGDVHLAYDEGTYPPWKDVAVLADLKATDRSVDLTSAVSLGKGKVLDLSGHLGAAVEALTSKKALAAAPVSLHAVGGPLPISKLLGQNFTVADGALATDVTLSGTLDAPKLSGKVKATDLRTNDQQLGHAEATVSYAGGNLAAHTVFSPVTGGSAMLDAKLEQELSLSGLAHVDVMHAPLEATLTSSGLDLKMLNLFPQVFRHASGGLDANLSVGGTLALPRPRGTLVVKDGEVAVAGYGTYRKVGLDLRIADNEVALKNAYVESGDGSMRVSGKAQRSSPEQPYAMNLALDMDKLPVVISDQQTATVTAKTQSWTGQIQGMKMGFDMSFSELKVYLPKIFQKDVQTLAPNPDFVVVNSRRNARTGKGATQQGSSLELQVSVKAPRNVWVESEDAKLEVGTSGLDVIVHEGKLALGGKIETKRGRADVLGRRFDLQPGFVEFNPGGPVNDPRLEVKAEHVNTREQVKVFVKVSGSGQKPKIDLTSQPAMDESEIATLLITGRRDLKRGTGSAQSSNPAASILGAVVADRLKKTVLNKAPLDVLSVDVGSDQGLKGTRVEAGKYLNDRTYVGYRANFGAQAEKNENTNEVRVEYQIAPKVTVESEYGDAGHGGADIFWTKDY